MTRHHHRRSVGRRFSLWIYQCQERYNLFWHQLRLRLERPRVSSTTTVLSDGRVKKKIRVSTARPFSNFSPYLPTRAGVPLLLCLILAFAVFLIFAEAYLNRAQIAKMTLRGPIPVEDAGE